MTIEKWKVLIYAKGYNGKEYNLDQFSAAVGGAKAVSMNGNKGTQESPVIVYMVQFEATFDDLLDKVHGLSSLINSLYHRHNISIRQGG